MPIANCLAPKELISGRDPEGLIEAWSQASGVAPDHMTINLVSTDGQVGVAYKAMAFLYLPSLWPADRVRDLQLGLAKALGSYFDLPAEDVHVITTVVESGRVIEDGQVQAW